MSYSIKDDGLIDYNVLSASFFDKKVMEVGGNLNPLCPSAIQVDLSNINSYEFLMKYSKKNLSCAPSDIWHVDILADAKSIPVDNESFDYIISKNFPWLGEWATIKIINPILKEYLRILKINGSAILVSGHNNCSHFKTHCDIALSLGFDVKSIFGMTNGPENLGALTEFLDEPELILCGKDFTKPSVFSGLIITKIISE